MTTDTTAPDRRVDRDEECALLTTWLGQCRSGERAAEEAIAALAALKPDDLITNLVAAAAREKIEASKAERASWTLCAENLFFQETIRAVGVLASRAQDKKGIVKCAID